MDTKLALVLAAAALALPVLSARAQGDLDPPPGAPAPNMKSLQELWDKLAAVESDVSVVQSDVDAVQTDINGVETDLGAIQTDIDGVETDLSGIQTDIGNIETDARTPITSLPITISSPGSYYFTGNLSFSATTGHAISITSRGVTLDLNGFQLSSSAGVTGDAISVNVAGSQLLNVTIRNGTIVGTTTLTGSSSSYSISLGGFNNGVFAGSGVTVESLSVSGCRTSGIRLSNDSRVSDCTISSNGGDGIEVNSGSLVEGCKVFKNGGIGITAASVCQVLRSTSRSNGGDGIEANRACVVSFCSASSNGGAGIRFIDGVGTASGVLSFSTVLLDTIETSANITRLANYPAP